MMTPHNGTWFSFVTNVPEAKKIARKLVAAKLFDRAACREYMAFVRECNLRKLKLLWVPRRFVFEMFDRKEIKGERCWLELDGGPLPDDVHVVDCFYSHERNCFGHLLRSRKYEPVPHGEMIPTLEVRCFHIVAREP